MTRDIYFWLEGSLIYSKGPETVPNLYAISFIAYLGAERIKSAALSGEISTKSLARRNRHAQKGAELEMNIVQPNLLYPMKIKSPF